MSNEPGDSTPTDPGAPPPYQDRPATVGDATSDPEDASYAYADDAPAAVELDDPGYADSVYEEPEHDATAEPALAATGKKKKKKKPGSFWKELPILVLIAFGLALLIKSFLIQAFYIPSESMVPTLNVGDRVLVNKVIYKIRKPRRGEVIVFVGERDRTPRSFWQRVRESLTTGFGGAQPRERDFIKRIIALPGETIEIARGVVTITPVGGGKPFSLEEPYIAAQRDQVPYGPYTVPKDSYFVLGDNRPNSSDSRTTLGSIKKSEIVGRAFVRVWPVKRFRGLGRPEYAAAFVGFGPIVAEIRRRRRRRLAFDQGG